MKRKEFITKARAQLTELLVEEDDPGLAVALKTLEEVNTVGDLFSLLAGECWDIPSAIEFVLEILIPDLQPKECRNIPLRGWST